MNFINDKEKMRDFYKLSKDEFLESYSYLKKEDYDETKKVVEQNKNIMLMEEIKGNEDLHSIARKIKLEDGQTYIPKTINRGEFIYEIEQEIQWQLDMVSPLVSKKILIEEYNKIDEIKIKEIDSIKENAMEFLKSNEEYSEFNIDYILKDNNKLNDTLVIASNYDEIIQIKPYDMEVKDLMDWAYNFDEDIFEELEKGKEISYMNIDVHYSIWVTLEKVYPDEIEYKNGVQKYLKYCKDNNITKERIEKEEKLDNLPDAMKYYKTEKQKNRNER